MPAMAKHDCTLNQTVPGVYGQASGKDAGEQENGTCAPMPGKVVGPASIPSGHYIVYVSEEAVPLQQGSLRITYQVKYWVSTTLSSPKSIVLGVDLKLMVQLGCLCVLMT